MTDQVQGVGAPVDPGVRMRQVSWSPFALVLAATAAIVIGSGMLWGWGEDGRQHMTRYTARVSFLVFVVVFAAGALYRLFPSDATRWLQRKRRYLGLSFALAHFLHLGALTTLFLAIGEWPDLRTIVFGGFAYLLIGLMAATSNDGAVRLLGARTWRGLHTFGAYYAWLIFMNSYAGRLASDTPPEPKVIFAITAALGMGALGLRIAAWLTRRKRLQPSPG
jgi:methionine sulfoxide reductase heme-binding subunit